MDLLDIKKGSKLGESIQIWQYFLRRKGLYTGPIDMDFGNGTESATKKYQQSAGIPATGEVKQDTYNAAMNDGMNKLLQDLETPPEPNFPAIGRMSLKQIFGEFRYVPDPTPEDNRIIKILDGWDRNNISTINIPQLVGVKVGKSASNGAMQVHKLLQNQMLGLWAAWSKSGLANKILTYEGSFVPRFIGGTTKLSYHSFGTTFDINYNWNKWGSLPAPLGDQGSVRELVPIANEFGFYWGGHFKSKKDGMHFEAAKLLAQQELQNLSTKYNLNK